jgi:N-ethylmaleimide reductase
MSASANTSKMSSATTGRLFQPFRGKALELKNRMVMAPMTRSRAVEANTPNTLMAEYYAQRATAGLIITEGTSPSPNGLGYPRMPGLFNDAHVAGWKLVTRAVHAKGGKIVVQLMHAGRVAHVANLPAGAEVLAPSALTASGDMHTDSLGRQPLSAPRAMTEADIRVAIDEFARSARLAMAAGFDGVELHGASGYLIEQFFNANINQRSDGYGGDPDRRNRFILDVARAVADTIGADKLGIRFSPHAGAQGAAAFPAMDAQLVSLVKELSALGLAYVHVVDYSGFGMPAVPAELLSALRKSFAGALIRAGGFDRSSAERELAAGHADLIAFGRPFIANPDLVERLRTDAALNAPEPSTFYTSGAKGYTDYPRLSVTSGSLTSTQLAA